MNFPFFSKLQSQRSQLRFIEEKLQEVVDTIEEQTKELDAPIREYMEKICKVRGKMLRPGLVLLTAAATGGIKKDHITFAAILEMLHMSSLVHDDVLDHADTRRGQPTSNALWGNSLAVLLGDILFSQAMVMGCEIGERSFMRSMALAVRDLCQGEVSQSSRLWDVDMTREEYYELIRKKTAVLFAIAMSGAAALQGLEQEIIERCDRIGTSLGIAYQIYDDCLDMTGSDAEAGKTLGSDAENGKLTLPVFFLMESSNKEVAQAVRESISRKKTIDYSLLRHGKAFKEALNLTIEEGLKLSKDARKELQTLPETDARDALCEMSIRLDKMLSDCRR